MRHIEVAGQTILQVVEDPAYFTPVDAVVRDHDVCREDGQGRGERPHMQIVHGGHFVEFEQVAAHLIKVNVLGRGLQKNPQCRTEELDGGLEHQGDDDQRCDRVGP